MATTGERSTWKPSGGSSPSTSTRFSFDGSGGSRSESSGTSNAKMIGKPMQSRPVIVRFSGESKVSATGMTPPSWVVTASAAKCPASATFSGADPLSPPCQTARPA